MKTSFDASLDYLKNKNLPIDNQGVWILEHVMGFLRERSRKTRRGIYSPAQKWFGAGNRWGDHADRDAYYCLYRLLAGLKRSFSQSKIPGRGKS